MSFNQFRLSSDILKGLKDTKIESPSSIQKKIFKAVQNKSDLVINTTIDQQPEVGYLISLLNSISKSDRRQGTRAIILAGNESRAKELDEWIMAIGYHASVESACLLSGNNLEEQKSILSAGPVVIVSTPGRLSELLEAGRIIFREVEMLIVDQAELIDDWDAVESISQRIIGSCQRVFTAAKDSKDLRNAEENLLNEPELVKIEDKKSQASSEPAIPKDLTQYYINVPPRSKISTLMALLDQEKLQSVVIFTASRRTADRLYKILRKSNKRAVSINKQLRKETYDERFQKFTAGNVHHLISGDQSAAELPLEHAELVINYDVPEEVEEYKLRAELVGTGKATKILSLVSKQDRGDIKTISKKLGYAPEEVPLPKSVKKDKSIKRAGKGSSKSSTKKSKKKTKKRGATINEFPQPTYDQLSGGKTGKSDKDKKDGIFGFIKNLFS